MAIYARIWLIVALVLGAAGLILALLTEPTVDLLGALAASGAIALSLGLGMSVGTGKQQDPMRFMPVFLVSLAVVATVSLLIVGVVTPVLIGALITATSPWALARIGVVSGSPSHVDDSVIEAMSTPDLALAWRATCRELAVARDPAMKARVVAIRAALLDELERRDHDAILCWLESGRPAEGDPTQYMHRGGSGDSRAA